MIVANMTHADYLAADGISNSDCGRIMQSPAHWMEWKQNPPEPSAAMLTGTAAHCQVLEPEDVADRFVQAPELDRRTKAGKEAWAAFQAEAEDKIILTADQWTKVVAIGAAVKAHPAATALLQLGTAEQSVFWRDGFTGLDCKCRPDWDTGEVLVDLKTTQDASPEGFSRTIAKYAYHRQAAFYLDGTATAGEPRSRFVFIAVETAPPYAVGVYELDPDSLDQGRVLYESALNRFAACIESGEWPAYSDECRTLTLPRWAFNDL